MLNTIEENILRSLRRIHRALDSHSRELHRVYGLTTPQLLCVRTLLAEGAINHTDLGRRLMLSQSTITGIVDRLEGRGLVERAPAPSNRRQVLVRLTEAGRALAEGSPEPLQLRFLEELRSRSRQRQLEIEAALQEIVEVLEAHDLEAGPLAYPQRLR